MNGSLAIVRSFLRCFGVSAADLPRQLADVERRDELLGQFPQTNWPSEDADNRKGLFLGCPLSKDRREWTAACLFWCPTGWPAGSYVSLVSSRLGRRLTEDPGIADAIRNFFVLLQQEAVVVFGQGMTLAGPLQRGVLLFGCRYLRLLPLPGKISRAWIDATLAARADRGGVVYYDAHSLSVDDLTFALCDQIRAVHVRGQGNIASLIHHYQRVDSGPLILQRVQHPGPAERVDRRATADPKVTADPKIAWYLYPQAATAEDRGRQHRISNPAPIRIGFQEWPGETLQHWTRGDQQPWPDQQAGSEFDALLVGGPYPLGPLASLCRILVQQRLLGSGRLIRGGQRVVCLTEVGLREFRRRRTYRPQLRRWDFELYGLSIRKTAIQRMGGRPVHYLTPQRPDPPPHLDPVWVVDCVGSHVDWSQEREWRVLGDIDLRRLPADEAVVFVPDHEAAAAVEPLSRWPILVLPPAEESQ